MSWVGSGLVNLMKLGATSMGEGRENGMIWHVQRDEDAFGVSRYIKISLSDLPALQKAGTGFGLPMYHSTARRME
jgi:hypothetical protein